ncbi:tRNA pseudouridine55 synthase [Weissella uvarum]|uniref:tRNA pseudouridine(55) synthase TruB n=1 Tax=Weissella uvarum TaxID=1479233 RepID=UPI001961C549|nr:tRNA pseudouridine(55) synthase TruB [Weissella uvarum]MBM7617570.1 tRNA pseudouridine55 synthase [Weissella uvarum]MCM0595548.1 tRNA pseudouridine(55) synthase TruB [Weissella uvarum]
MEGILPINKPTGMTSHDVVYKLRKILHTKKIGHAGTLDPNVDGVLPIAIGKATKSIEFLQEAGKIYTGFVTLGFATATEDLDGEIVDEIPILKPFTTDEIDQAMKTLVGDIIQIPPMYSAVKVNGRRLYDYARAGETVERPHRQATIYEFKRMSRPVYDAVTQTQSFAFEAKVSKGTYIRTLAVDLGAKLGVASVMSQLTRQASGGFNLAESHTIDAVAQQMHVEGTIDEWLFPIDRAVAQYSAVDVPDAVWERIKHGIGLPADQYPQKDEKIVVKHDGEVKSVFAWSSEKEQYRPYRTFKNE